MTHKVINMESQIIDRCDKCPFSEYDIRNGESGTTSYVKIKYTCTKTCKVIPFDDIIRIPDWCPLPDKKEKVCEAKPRDFYDEQCENLEKNGYGLADQSLLIETDPLGQVTVTLSSLFVRRKNDIFHG